MKQRDLILGLGFLGAFTMAAQSPYTGSVAPTEGSADFYLYQVESGMWLENNSQPNFWTTRAGLGKTGFDVAVKAIEGGYQLDPKLNGNRSINGEGLYMDTGRAVTTWGLVPVTVDGVSNAYNIQMLVCDQEGYDNYLLGENNGVIADVNPEATNTTWQLVSRADRISHMKAEAANGPVDATWLIPGGDFSRNQNPRYEEAKWVHKFTNQYGGGVACDGSMHNSVREAWHHVTGYSHYVVLTDLPNGTYRFRVQGYYRQNWEDADAVSNYVDDTWPRNPKYFAGAYEKPFRHILSEVFEAPGEGPSNEWKEIAELNQWVPDKMNTASLEFLNDRYQNEWIETVVTDGNLIVGVTKLDGLDRDWFVYDNFQLQYVSDETPAVDLTEVIESLNNAIKQVEALQQTPGSQKALEVARQALTSTSGTEIRLATIDLLNLIDGLTAGANSIKYFNETLAIEPKLNTYATRAMEMFNTATSKSEFDAALKQLRFARRRLAADRQEDIFKGSAPEPNGQYYLYNIGQRQFLCGGSDWGAHAALGMPGILITLEEENAEDMTYHIDTQLYNGDTKHYMNYPGYLDCDKAGAWKFVPVEGKENVYRILQNDYQDACIAYDPDAKVDNEDGDGGRTKDETTVSGQFRGVCPAGDDEWKLVSREEREALMETATLENPIDATFYLISPGFNQRENVETGWSFTNTKVCDRGSRRSNFVVESWDSEDFDVSQTVVLPEGVYAFTVNAFYRNGHHVTELDSETGEVTVAGQPDQEMVSNAIMYATMGTEADHHIKNILEESGKAPGQGADVKSLEGVTYHYPQYTDQASDFFRNGLYKNQTFFHTDGSDCPIGIMQDPDMIEWLPRHWMVCDNFRLKYFGNNTTVEEAKAGIEEVVVDDVNAAEFKGDNRIFNLQGIQVKNTDAPGIYIQNGKKFVVR